MAQNDMNVANQGFPAFRADLNDQLEALVTNSSGATAPATTFPHQWWLDTSTTPSTLRQRNAANDAWIVVGLLNQSTNTFNVPVAQGGTGLATLTANNVLLGNGTSAVQAVAPGTSGNVLTSNGTTWESAAAPTPTIASTAEAEAGTNNTNFITPLRMREGFNASGSAPVYACRAWVNFNGTGTVAIRASGNVSSITDNGTGDYTVNFTTAMPDANYAVAGTAMRSFDNSISGNAGHDVCIKGDSAFGSSFSTASIRVLSKLYNDNAEDALSVSVTVFR
jgi:hypothetical protein